MSNDLDVFHWLPNSGYQAPLKVPYLKHRLGIPQADSSPSLLDLKEITLIDSLLLQDILLRLDTPNGVLSKSQLLHLINNNPKVLLVLFNFTELLIGTKEYEL